MRNVYLASGVIFVCLVIVWAVSNSSKGRWFAGDTIPSVGYVVGPGTLVIIDENSPLVSAKQQACSPNGSGQSPRNTPCYIDWDHGVKGLVFMCLSRERVPEMDCATARKSK